jgi:CheY-like chemotaxis protein
VRIDVLDSGRGIDPAHHQHIFQEFYRVDGESADVSKGMGLGLHIVARTAEVLGAALAVRSALGCGARFSVTLPIARPRQISPEPDRAVAVGSIGAQIADLEGLRVLLLEPDDKLRDTVAGLLVSWGCDVLAQANLEPALLQMQVGDFVPGVVLCDVALTGFTGQDAVQSQFASLGAVVDTVRRRCGEQVEVCVLGGPADAALRAQWQQQGLAVLDKPVRPAKLRAWLRRFKSRA